MSRKQFTLNSLQKITEARYTMHALYFIERHWVTLSLIETKVSSFSLRPKSET